MNDCYLSLLLNFRALLSIDSGANLVNSKQAIGVILPDLSLLGYAVPVESFGIGLFSRPLKSTHLRDIARKQCPADFFNK